MWIWAAHELRAAVRRRWCGGSGERPPRAHGTHLKGLASWVRLHVLRRTACAVGAAVEPAAMRHICVCSPSTHPHRISASSLHGYRPLIDVTLGAERRLRRVYERQRCSSRTGSRIQCRPSPYHRPHAPCTAAHPACSEPALSVMACTLQPPGWGREPRNTSVIDP